MIGPGRCAIVGERALRSSSEWTAKPRSRLAAVLPDWRCGTVRLPRAMHRGRIVRGDHRCGLASAALRRLGPEWPGHPFFIATLFVPQTQSRPGKPHPLTQGFVQAVLGLQGSYRRKTA
jgi:hypothetical protein